LSLFSLLEERDERKQRCKVQCKWRGHRGCSLWIDLKNLPSQNALLQWLVEADSYPRPPGAISDARGHKVSSQQPAAQSQPR